MDDRIMQRILSLLPAENLENRRFRYSIRVILLVGSWAMLKDRPINWACEACNWPDWLRPAALPHPSTMSRRWRRADLQAQAEIVFQESVRQLSKPGRYAVMDGRPLVVGGATKDKEATAGRAVRGLGRGYKLHTLIVPGQIIATYAVYPLNVAEQGVARELLTRAPAQLTRILADTLYDSTHLHAVAAESGRRLYTPLRGHRVGRRRQPRRLQLMRLWERAVGRKLMHSRDEIERTFAQTSAFACGFKGLPPWARRLHRVRRWVWGKIVVYHAYLLTKRAAA